MVSYAVKANSNLGLLGLLAKAGAGFDVVSGGELFRVVKAGGDPARVVFSGVGKTAAEIEYALSVGIQSLNCESEGEIALIGALAARCGVKARIALRVNPNVDAGTHPYISTGLKKHKFGIDAAEAEAIYRKAQESPHLLPDGVSCHIGSQLLDTDPLLEALDRLLELVEARVRQRIEEKDLFLVLEPGRSIVAEAGVLLTRVLYRKTTASREFVIVDAAMNDLLRPSLYRSHHEIVPLRQNPRGTIVADVVGPGCESGDFLALDREMPTALPGDVLAIWTAGAYGFVLSSNYNSRVRPAEVLVEGGAWRTARARETYDDLIRGETV